MARNASGARGRGVRGVPLRQRTLALLLGLVLPAAALSAIVPAAPAEALSGSEFNPEYIISDELFYDGAAMTAAQIQSFLDNKIGSCQTDRCLNVAVVPVASQAATYSPSTGNLFCGPIAGGSLRVSELIYRTQAACGISAKVILVTLQKEQGLVTNKAPSDRALRAAMGMGCPDTAPCSDAFAGLATQIISGSRQLVVYRNGKFARQPGNHYIQFNPNADCGGTYLTIRNYATAALYNYTPYQPNSAALANLGTTGDGCSSYGNRNFWTYYSNWFGPTTVPVCTTNPSRDITRHWEDLGGEAGPLGAPVTPGIVAGDAGTTIGFFTNGDVYCTPRVGAYAVIGDIRDKFEALGGPASSLGPPVSTRITYTAGGVSGFLQEFQRGTMLSSTTTGSFAVLHGAMRDGWGSRGGSAGSLGWPTGDQEAVTGGLRQRFQNGVLVVPTGQPSLVLTGEIALFWSTGTNASALGLPTAAATPWTAGGVTGTLQQFQKGMVLSSVTTGTYAVLTGAIRDAWGGQGGSGGPLGWPIGDQVAVTGGFRQDFERGTIVMPSTGNAFVMTSAIATYWTSGSNATRLGTPTGSAVAWSAGGVTGMLQYFQKGMVLSSETTGTYSVLNGALRDKWAAQGGSGGALGWPTADQQSVTGGVSQQFQRGTLTAAGAGIAGDIAAYAASGSNPTLLGAATGPATAWTAGGVTGMLQYFQKGMVLSSTTTGTYAVLNGPMRDKWGAQGGSAGAVGWPTADQQTVAGVVSQQFQRGTLTTAGSGPASDIATYLATGSNATLLGAATGPATAWTAGGVTGMLQYFQKGMVLSSTTTGTYAVLNGPMRDKWGAQGGSGGTLGWPTADQQTVAGVVSQQFQRGTLSTAGSGPVSDIAAYVATGSNATLLGAATGPEAAFTAGGVTGKLQYFQKGMVLSSTTTGTHAVLDGPIRSSWGAQGGSGGTLGWPTGDQQAVTGGLSQEFQHGTINTGPVDPAAAITAYLATGSNATFLGTSKGAATPWTAGGVTGMLQYFQRGMVLSSATTGTFAVLDGPMRNAWSAQGGSAGAMGWPTGDQQVVAGGIRQQFQNGSITVTTDGMAIGLSGEYSTYYSTSPIAILLGNPLPPVVAWTAGGVTGSYLQFQRGMVLSSPTTGTFAVLDGPVRTFWGAQGGSAGALGWPTGDQQAVTGGLSQQFQNGTIMIPTTGSPYIIP